MNKLIAIVVVLSACGSPRQYKLTYGDAQGQAHAVYFDSKKECADRYNETVRRRIHGYQTLSTCELK